MDATLQVINQLQAAGIIGKYAIGGAVGATFYLEPIATLDLDIFISVPQVIGGELASLTPLYEALKSRGYRAEGTAVVIEGWPVQFLPCPNALAEEAVTRAITTEVSGVAVRVMTAEHLVALALETGRPKDLARISQFLEAGACDAGTLQDILTRYELSELWEQFEQRYRQGR